jgi:uncharacterized membrane protein
MTQETEKSWKERWESLQEAERRALKKILSRKSLIRNTEKDFSNRQAFGDRVADKVAAFGGSWTFIIIFVTVLLSWVIVNSFVLLNRAFDPYPYILLNLFLSMIAAIQAPIIMMSQNRQAAKDRLDAEHDYEVNLKSEMEIMALHEKLDDLRETKWIGLVEMQQRQIEILQELLKSKN